MKSIGVENLIDLGFETLLVNICGAVTGLEEVVSHDILHFVH